MSLLVGSLALNLYLDRQVNDLDLIIQPEQLQNQIRYWKPKRVEVLNETKVVLHQVENLTFTKNPSVELELAWPGSTAEEILRNGCSSHIDYGPEFWVMPDLATLYWLKMSHRFKKNTPHFEKTWYDIQDIRNLPYRTAPQLMFNNPPAWYKRRESETLAYNHPNLAKGQTKDAFFAGDGVQYFYDHDWLHNVVAGMFNETVPAYRLYLKDGEEVACDRGKFEDLLHTEKIRGVVEEALVLALERSQIPARLDPNFRKDIDPGWSFKYALQKVCTSITSGWFREFSWENYEAALDRYPKNYAELFWAEAEREGNKARLDY